MIRIVRTYKAHEGKRRQVVDVLIEISQYAATKNIRIQVLLEPWGDSRSVHIHTDYEEADTALHFLDELFDNPKAEEARHRLDELTEGDEGVAFLTTLN